MKQGIFTITVNRPIARGTYYLQLEGEFSGFTTPGQFAELCIPGKYLRRPFSVCDFGDGWFSAVYKAAGSGTELLSSLKAGARLDILTGLGNGFDLSPAGDAPLLIGGGTGVSPLYGLAKRLSARGARPTALLGFGCESDAFLIDKFTSLGIRTLTATADGSLGTEGNVVELARGKSGYIYACGPAAMLRAVSALAVSGGQASLEARMGCGFGACMGCSIMTSGGAKRVCRDGPVFRMEELIW